MMAPPPRNELDHQLRNEINAALSGSCSSAITDAPLFLLSESETSFVNCQSGLPINDKDLYKEDDLGKASTYGEVTLLGARQLFYHMGLYSNHDTNYQFFDLGSGGGRLVIQSHLELPSVSRSVGIELSPTRHEAAAKRLNDLKSNEDLIRIRQLAYKAWDLIQKSSSEVNLHEGNLFQLDISEATHIYLSSLCFSEDMLERIVHKVETEGGEALQIVASLRLLPKNKSKVGRAVKLGENPWQEFIEMTWNRGDGCPVYFYTVKHNIID